MNKLQLFNNALRLCSERKLASLAEEREPRRLLDDVWDDDGVDSCLEMGLWQFATRAVKLDYSPSVVPPFGFTRAFDKPEDFIRTAAVSSDEFFTEPLHEYTEEAGFWFADLDQIYVKYISNDAQYGADMSLWPRSFASYVSAYFASEIVPRLTADKERVVLLDKIMGKRLSKALMHDAMAEPTKFRPAGNWVRARRGRSRGDGGPTNRFI